MQCPRKTAGTHSESNQFEPSNFIFVFHFRVFFSLPFCGSRATLATRIQGANVVLDFFLELRHLFIFLVFKTSMLVGGWNLNTKCYI